MTDEQINIAIAESLGWKLLANNRWTKPCGIYADLPNYTADLNAMHEVENVLDLQACVEYARWLRDVVLMKTKLPWDYGSFAHIHATARQRCEAYLKTIGKWIE